MQYEWPQSEEEWLTIQKRDPECVELLRRLVDLRESKLAIPRITVVKSSNESYEFYQPRLVNGALGALRVRVLDTESVVNENQVVTDEEDRFYMPYQLYRAVLLYYHDSMGHPGAERIYLSLRLKYYWPAMQSDVKHYVGACRWCKVRKTGRATPRPVLQHLTVTTRPFQRVHIDLVECGRSSLGYKYICVMQDALTRWVELIPLWTKSADEVARVITENITYRHGCIETLVTDRGTEFRNNILRAINDLTRTKHQFNTSANPQANTVERFNAVLKDMLASFVAESKQEWDTYIRVIAHSYNVTVNSTTGFSPFRMLYGREAKLPTEQWVDRFATTKGKTINDYVRKLTEALQFSWGLGAMAMIKRVAKMSEALQEERLGASPHARIFKPFRVGQKFYLKTAPKRMFVAEREVKPVFLEDSTSPDAATTMVRQKLKYAISGKLFSRYTGPHEVYEVINPVVYVAIVDGALRTVHANKMKRDIHTDDEVVEHNRRLRVSPFYQKSMTETATSDAREVAKRYVKETLPKTAAVNRLEERRLKQQLDRDQDSAGISNEVVEVQDSSSDSED